MEEEEDQTTVWTTRMLDERNRKDRIDRVGLGRAEASTSSKRKEEVIPGKSRKSKKQNIMYWGRTGD